MIRKLYAYIASCENCRKPSEVFFSDQDQDDDGQLPASDLPEGWQMIHNGMPFSYGAVYEYCPDCVEEAIALRDALNDK